jgi:uncharacterized membrane protein YebE (DUF533 family)
MFNMNDILGALTQSGVSGTSGKRMRRAMTDGGKAPRGMLDGLFGGAGGDGIGNVLGTVLEDASRAVGGRQNLAVGGIGALAGALLGGGKRAMGSAVGVGVASLLGAMAFSALKKGGQPAPQVPAELKAVRTPEEEQQVDRKAALIFRAMINAAKADGEIDRAEADRIVGKIGEMGGGQEAQSFVLSEMQKPMETDALIAEASGRPELAAQLYAASLLAIEVDTPAEKAYLQDFGQRLGLNAETVTALEEALGV